MSKSNLSKRASARIPEPQRKAAVVKSDKAIAATLAKAVAEKEAIKRSTLGLYSLKTDASSFGVPFCAVSDHYALLAQKQILPCSNLYCVGSFCLYDGKTVSCRPRLILDNKVSNHG